MPEDFNDTPTETETEPSEPASQDTEPTYPELAEAEDEFEDIDGEVNDEDKRLADVLETVEGFTPAKKDATDLALIFDEQSVDSFREFAKSRNWSLGRFQRVLAFQLKIIRSGVKDDKIALSHFVNFNKRERMPSTDFDATVEFQKNYAAEYTENIRGIQENAIRASGRPNPRAHEIYILAGSAAWNSKNNPGHPKAIAKMIELCNHGRNK